MEQDKKNIDENYKQAAKKETESGAPKKDGDKVSSGKNSTSKETAPKKTSKAESSSK